MNRLIVTLFLFAGSFAFGQQQTFETWVKLEAEGEFAKRTDWSVALNTRFGDRGVNTIFPQLGIEYKVFKWLRPSIEYRFVFDQDKYTNFSSAHRINFNLNLKKKIERFSVAGRVRYQYAFNQIGSGQQRDPDFDQAIRAKVVGKYDINDSFLTPLVSCEVFYDPQFSEISPAFSKIRVGGGFSFELDGPHKASVKYLYDKRLNDYSRDTKHILALTYGYKF